MIKRYNQGFITLYQCSDGELMKADEVLKELLQLSNKIEDSMSDSEGYRRLACDYSAEIQRMSQRDQRNESYIAVLQNALFFAAAVMAATLLIVVYEMA